MSGFTINLQPLLTDANQALQLFIDGAIPVLGTALGVFLRNHFKFLSLKTDQQVTAMFESALQNGSTIAMNSLQSYEGEHNTVAVKSWIAAKAAQYAIDHNQSYMKRFTGMNFDDVAQKALAELPQITVEPSIVVLPTGQTLTLGKPSPKQTPQQEVAETKALNEQAQPK